MKKLSILRLCMISFLTLFLVACDKQAGTPPVADNEVEQELPGAAELNFDLPEDYEEAAKDFATDFTLNWAKAYRGGKGWLLQAVLDKYNNIIDQPTPYNDIVLAWNNSHNLHANVYPLFVAGPTVSSVTLSDKYIESNAVRLTVVVTTTGTIQRYSEVVWDYTGYPINVTDTGTYEMYYNATGWHCNAANLSLNG